VYPRHLDRILVPSPILAVTVSQIRDPSGLMNQFISSRIYSVYIYIYIYIYIEYVKISRDRYDPPNRDALMNHMNESR